jgi:hypothetical protein
MSRKWLDRGLPPYLGDVIFKLLGTTHGLPSCRAKADQVTTTARGY